MFTLFKECEGGWQPVGEYATPEEAVNASDGIDSFRIEMKVCGGSRIVYP